MLFDENKNIATCPKKIANILQRQFNSVFSDPSKTEIESATFDSPPLPSPHVEEMIEFSKEDIMEAIDDIKPSAAAGPDEIPVSLLKNCKTFTRRTHPSDLVKFFVYKHGPRLLQNFPHCSYL